MAYLYLYIYTLFRNPKCIIKLNLKISIMKVAHVLKNFEPGGVEKWLLDITKLNNQSNNSLELDFLLQSNSNGYFSSEIISNNGKIKNIVYSKYNFLFYLIKLFICFKKK